MNNKVITIVIILTLGILIFGIVMLAKDTETSNDVKLNNNEQTSNSAERKESTVSGAKTYTSAPAMQIDVNKNYTAIMKTSKGNMEFKLFPSETPVTVNNFVFLAKADFYNETKFHRIMKNFMIQGGDPKGTGTGGPGYKFADESITRDYKKGTLAMANSGPDTNGSQFFIMTVDYPLSKDYVIFGELITGEYVLDMIASTPVKASSTGEMSFPTENVLINRIEIIEN